MRISVYTRNHALSSEPRLVELIGSLRAAGHVVSEYDPAVGLDCDTDLMLAVGGDGTFLSSAAVVGDSGVPVLGVNLGRLGFLSENVPEVVASGLASGSWKSEKRSLLHVLGVEMDWPHALNEVSVHRNGAAMLGVDVTIDGVSLPTYWADGLLIATSSGSTAYSLSVGGPIVLPDSKVLIISPIAPHNLNVRPMIVPDGSDIRIRFQSRDTGVVLSVDNRTAEIPASSEIEVRLARFSLNRVCLKDSDFIKALTTKLFWGEDIRNGNEQ